MGRFFQRKVLQVNTHKPENICYPYKYVPMLDFVGDLLVCQFSMPLKKCSSWTVQILELSRKFQEVTPFFAQNDIKSIKTPYLIEFP